MTQLIEKSRMLFVVMLCIISLASGAPQAAFAEDPPDEPILNTIRVMTYNVWGLPKPFLKDRGRFPEIKKLLPSTGADIIGLQESFTDYSKVLYDIPEYPYRVRGEQRKRPHALFQGDGLGLLSRYPLSRVQRLRFDDCKGTDCLARKGALLATVEHPAGAIDVIVTHLNSVGNDKIRLKQTEELIDFIGRHCGERPLIILGDFNSSPVDQPLIELKSRLWVDDAHLDFVTANPELPKADKDAFTFDYSQNTTLKKKDGHSRRIDYVLFRSGTQKNLRTIRTHIVMNETVGGRHLSDHFGFTADLMLE